MHAQILIFGRVTERGVLVFKGADRDLPLTCEFAIRDRYVYPHPITGKAVHQWDKWHVQARGEVAREIIDTVQAGARVFVDGRPDIRRINNPERTQSHAIRLIQAYRVQVIEGPVMSNYQMLAEQGELPWHDPREWEEHPQRGLLQQDAWKMGAPVSSMDRMDPASMPSPEECESASLPDDDPSPPRFVPGSPIETDSP